MRLAKYGWIYLDGVRSFIFWSLLDRAVYDILRGLLLICSEGYGICIEELLRLSDGLHTLEGTMQDNSHRT